MTRKVKFRLCPKCKGHGEVVNPSVSVWTGSDRAEDPEGFEAMMSGEYDVKCPCCYGLRVVTNAQIMEYNSEVEDQRLRMMESGERY